MYSVVAGYLIIFSFSSRRYQRRVIDGSVGGRALPLLERADGLLRDWRSTAQLFVPRLSKILDSYARRLHL